MFQDPEISDLSHNFTLASFWYPIYPEQLERQAWATQVDPDQTAQDL